MKLRISKEIKVGIFGLAMMFVLYWGINFLKGMNIMKSNHEYYVKYSKSDNIEVSSPVLIRGIKIGSVTAVELGDIRSDVLVTLTVEDKYEIPVNSIAVLTNKSMLGGKAIDVEIGDANTYFKNNDYIPGHIDNNVSMQIEEVKSKLTVTVDELTTTLSKINNMLSEQTISDVTLTVSNLSKVSGTLSVILDSERKKLSDILSNLSSITEEFDKSAPMLTSTITNLSKTSEMLPAFVVNANKTMDDLDQTIIALNNPSGTIGKMLNDPGVYNNLDQATLNLSSLLSDIKENPKRYVHFSVFGGANKNKVKHKKDK